MNNPLDGFVLPSNVAEAGAREDVAKMGLSMQTVGDGVQMMSGHSKTGIPYRFFNDTVYNHRKSLEAGHEVYDSQESIEFRIDKKTIHVTEIRFLDPERLRFNLRGEIVGGEFFEDYKRWKAGMDAPGLSLDRWEAVTPQQVRTLNAEQIFTVEQLASVPRTRITDIFGSSSEFVEVFERAICFQGNKEIAIRNKEAADKLVAMAEELARTREEMTSLREQVRENTVAKLKKTRSKRKTKRKVNNAGAESQS